MGNYTIIHKIMVSDFINSPVENNPFVQISG